MMMMAIPDVEIWAVCLFSVSEQVAPTSEVQEVESLKFDRIAVRG